MKKLIVSLFVIVLSLNLTHAGTNKSKPALIFSNIIIPEAPPTVAVMVAYVDIENTSSTAQTIIKIESPQFKRIEIHKTSSENGVLSMRQIKKLELKGKQRISLKSGDLHVMLINPTKPLKNGSSIELTFKLASGEMATINTHVKVINFDDEHKNHH